MASADHISQSHDSQSPQDEPIVRGRLLDGFLLLASGGFMLPDEAVRVNLSSLEIVEVSDDLRFFHNLDSLDLSDNFLNYSGVLEHIFVTPRLSSLNLSCNQIATLTCNPNPVQYPSAFHALTQLDLSFNELHGDILMTLAPLPKLEKLNLTANCISSRSFWWDLLGARAVVFFWGRGREFLISCPHFGKGWGGCWIWVSWLHVGQRWQSQLWWLYWHYAALPSREWTEHKLYATRRRKSSLMEDTTQHGDPRRDKAWLHSRRSQEETPLHDRGKLFSDCVSTPFFSSLLVQASDTSSGVGRRCG